MNRRGHGLLGNLLRLLGWLVGAPVLLLLVAWSVGAWWYDFPMPALRLPLACVYALAWVGWLFFARTAARRCWLGAALLAVVPLWWCWLRPEQTRQWQPDVTQTPWAEITGDSVTLHHVRNCEYRTDTDFTPRWEVRTVRLSQLNGLDFFLCHEVSPHLAHPIVSFRFADAPPVAISIEPRREVGESSSAVKGFYRQYELVYVIADERDVVRVRTNYRTAEDVYLYHLNATPETARALFLEYLRSANELRTTPRWYHTLSANFTTSWRLHLRAIGSAQPWDWRLLATGHVDERAYDLGALDAEFPFSELKSRSLINLRALSADRAPDFSDRIRAGLPGFPAPAEAAPAK